MAIPVHLKAREARSTIQSTPANTIQKQAHIKASQHAPKLTYEGWPSMRSPSKKCGPYPKP